MASRIHFRLKNALEKKSVTFDGAVIQVGDIKRLIAEQLGASLLHFPHRHRSVVSTVKTFRATEQQSSPRESQSLALSLSRSLALSLS